MVEFSIKIAQLRAISLDSGKHNNHERIIDENLRRVFEQTLDEGIPDRFKDLLDQLKQQDQSRGNQE